MKCAIRQGGILSPFLFAIFIDDVVNVVQHSNFGFHFGIVNLSIFLYADDILLLAPSVFALQQLVLIVESFLLDIDMSINSKKTVCMRAGPDYMKDCAPIALINGDPLKWVKNLIESVF